MKNVALMAGQHLAAARDVEGPAEDLGVGMQTISRSVAS